MKVSIPSLLVFSLVSQFLAAQEVPPSAEQLIDTVTESGINPILSDDLAEVSLGKRTFIPHALAVRPFTPPPPPVVKRLPAMRIDANVTHLSKNARTLSLQRGEASTEPDLPPPPPPPPYVAPREPTPEEIAQRIWQKRHDYNFGASVYDHKISVVNWTDQISLVRYEAVCGFDIGLLAGVGSFVHNGEKFRFSLLHSDYDTTGVRRFARQWHLKLPNVSLGEIIITRGDVKDTDATAPMTVVKEIIAAETPRLLTYQNARATYFAAHTAWQAAHPTIPRNHTFILRPHRGSRYLPDAKQTETAQP